MLRGPQMVARFSSPPRPRCMRWARTVPRLASLWAYPDRSCTFRALPMGGSCACRSGILRQVHFRCGRSQLTARICTSYSRAGTLTRDGWRAISERVGFLTWRRPKPAPLYEGPLFFAVPTVDQRNRIIFVVGDEPESRELMRFDATLRRFEPYFRGMPARWVRFSSDGQWVAYVHASDLTLWRSRADGSDPLQLTVPPLRAFTPDWSPDGKMLAFAASEPGKVSKICTISRDGGLAQPE